MKYLLFILSVCGLNLVTPQKSFSQVFTPMGNGFDGPVRGIAIDTTNNFVYAAGNFINSGNLTVNLIAVWNGMSWDSMGGGNSYTGFPVRDVIVFQGNLIAGGKFPSIGGASGAGIGLWNGSSWLNIGNLLDDNLYSGGVSQLKILDNKLLVLGTFNFLDTVPASNIVSWDGMDWLIFPTFDTTDAELFCSAIFNNDLYVGGNFIGSQFPVSSDILRYDGVNWNTVSNGIPGGFSSLNCMIVYQNELYIGGWMQTTSGDPGNYIAKWDGFTWTDIGGNMDGPVNDFVIQNGELYVVGGFNYADGVPAQYFAKWNGMQWYGFPGVSFNNVINTIEAHNGEFYLGGAFTDVSGMPANRIVKCSFPLGIQDNVAVTNDIKVYQNSATGILTVESKSALLENISIFNMLGNLILDFALNTNVTEIKIGNYPSGIYNLEISTSEGLVNKKVMFSNFSD